MIDIRDPKNPTFAGCFAHEGTGRRGTGYTHDAQCVMYKGPDTDYTGREICMGSNETALSIADVTDKQNTKVISRAEYPNPAYTHQGWFTDDHRYFYVNDEGDETGGLVPRTRTLIWDLQNLDDPVLVKEHMGTQTSSDHNLYIRGNLMYQSNYRSGLRILDISDPVNPVEVAFFDTHPIGENSPGFQGSWSNYPFFASGTIIVTGIGEGLYVVKKRPTTVF
jgi:choice-of-anchor B domain-containing protein